MNLSLNQTLLTFLLYVRQTWMTQWILVISQGKVIFPLNRKEFVTHAHGLAVYIKEGLSFAQNLTIEKIVDLQEIFLERTYS